MKKRKSVRDEDISLVIHKNICFNITGHCLFLWKNPALHCLEDSLHSDGGFESCKIWKQVGDGGEEVAGTERLLSLWLSLFLMQVRWWFMEEAPCWTWGGLIDFDSERGRQMLAPIRFPLLHQSQLFLYKSLFARLHKSGQIEAYFFPHCFISLYFYLVCFPKWRDC